MKKGGQIMLTRAQLKYIMAIRALAGGQVSQKNICEYLNVKKSTASIALKNLEEMGYIEKQGINYCLKKIAFEVAEEKDRERLEFLQLFNNFLGIDEKLCLDEYDSVFGCFSKKFVDKLTEIRKNGYGNKTLEVKESLDNAFFDLTLGSYELPFQVVQCDNSSRSMGDKGFFHPAELIIEAERKYIILRAREIYYKAQNEQILRGSLQKLSYLDTDMKWLEAQCLEDKWIIPFEKIMYQRDSYGKISIGIIKIKAASTTIKMPESVADITFNFKLIKQIQNND